MYEQSSSPRGAASPDGEGQTILARSTNDPARVEAEVRERRQSVKRFNIFVFAITAFLCLLALVLFGREADDLNPGLYLPITLFVIAVLVAAFGAVTGHMYDSKMKILMKKKHSYRQRCAAESLVAGDDVLIGTTAETGARYLSLAYADIASVQIIPARCSVDVVPLSRAEEILLNDQMRILDKQGKKYNFYSFSNCGELKAVIEQQMAQAKPQKPNT